MRVALISDIHGNFIALRAVLRDIESQKIDDIICLGDIATIGHQPNQVIRELQAVGCACIMGNHDLALLDVGAALRYHIARPLLPALHWCHDQLGPQDLAYLQSFTPSVEITLEREITLLCYHGSPAAPTDLILSTTTEADLERMIGSKTAMVMAGGHTHLPMVRRHTGCLLINPGSVGSAFPRHFVPGEIPFLAPWAEYAIIEAEQGVVQTCLRRIPFDVHTVHTAVMNSTIPIKAWWLAQYGG